MRTINWDEPLSEDDKAWLRQRDKHAEVEANEKRFAVEADPTGSSDDDDEATDDYDKWKVPELAAEAAKREPAVDITGLSKKSDLIAALRTWDAANPDA
jgi:hypothetical protein